MTERLAFGYMRIADTSPADSDELTQQMKACVASYGFVLGNIFIDSGESAVSAFADLMDALYSSRAEVVVVPSMKHLARMEGVGTAMMQHIEHETGASVIIANAGRGEGTSFARFRTPNPLRLRKSDPVDLPQSKHDLKRANALSEGRDQPKDLKD